MLEGFTKSLFSGSADIVYYLDGSLFFLLDSHYFAYIEVYTKIDLPFSYEWKNVF